MKKTRTIVSLGAKTEYMILHANGHVEREQRGVAPSEEWRIIEAVTRNNFGHITRFYSLEEIMENPESIPWRYANGNQKTYLRDLDRGTLREWRSPRHEVY